MRKFDQNETLQISYCTYNIEYLCSELSTARIVRVVSTNFFLLSVIISVIFFQSLLVTTNNLSHSVEPHNDYFSVNFLLTFPVTGLHTVHIRADVIDENETLWKTGPTSSLSVKSYDDSLNKKPVNKPVRTSFGQMPPSVASSSGSSNQ